MTAANALLGDYFQQQARERWLGYQSILGPFLNGGLAIAAGRLGDAGWNWPFAANAVTLAALVWSLWAIWEPQRARPQAAAAGSPAVGFPWRHMLPVYGLTLLTSLIFYVPAIHFGLIFDQLGSGSTTRIATLMTIATAASLAGGFYFSRQRASTALNLALVYGGFGVGLLGMGLARGDLMGLPFALLINFSIGLTLPLLISWALRTLPDASRGRGMGLWMSSFFIAQSACPPLFAEIAHASGGILPAVQRIGALVLALAIAFFVIAFTRNGDTR